MALIVCMGVSGVGKSTVALALAERLGGSYLDADDYHPPANKQKMAQGIALQDDDRWGWLDALNRAVVQRDPDKCLIVLACSALKQSYRDRLMHGVRDVTFVYLKAPPEIVYARLGSRSGHFMPASLLASQLAALEEPDPDSTTARILTVDASAPVTEIVGRVASALQVPIDQAP